MESKPFDDYLLDDFVGDQSFRQWVKSGEKEAVLFWSQWVARHPEKTDVIEQARQFVLTLSQDSDAPFEEEMVDLWRRISQSTEAAEQVVSVGARPLWSRPVRWAAAFTGLLIASGLAWFALNRWNQIRYTTAYGETRTIRLPDQSTVVLNANSAIHYRNNWHQQASREVWLSGEAYFSVTHTRSNQKFIVHTRNVAVEALGTQFDVNARRCKTLVVLNSGKVKLHIPQHEADSVLLKPGELAEVSSHSHGITKKMVNTQKYVSWRGSQLVFDETSLKEIANLLEDNFGLKVRFKNPELANQTFTGTIDQNNIEILFAILEKTFGLTITRSQNYITISD